MRVPLPGMYYRVAAVAPRYAVAFQSSERGARASRRVGGGQEKLERRRDGRARGQFAVARSTSPAIELVKAFKIAELMKRD